jgi:hypothetical protein
LIYLREINFPDIRSALAQLKPPSGQSRQPQNFQPLIFPLSTTAFIAKVVLNVTVQNETSEDIFMLMGKEVASSIK